jgi:VCBS repeat-containing protein
MRFGSHAETGDERNAAAAAPLAGTIGNSQTAASCPPGRASDTATRSRRLGIEAGILSWLTALTFSLTKEANAADPNVTFLDDGNITYKDLEHGAFELVTKEAVPRHIVVEDPGVTVVLHPQGSSVIVNQLSNSPARMAELQEAQQEVLSNATKGVGSTGSSTPPFDNSLPVQPINFIQNDSIQPVHNALTPLPASFVSVPETIIGHLPPPAPTPPTFGAFLAPTETDTIAFDTFNATSGTFAASTSNGAPLTFGISGGTTGSTVVGGETFNVSRVGPFGTLFVNSANGDFTFVPNNDAINALTEPTVATFTITVSDGTLSANQTFTIAINGTNDAAVISGDSTGSTVEAGSGANAPSGPLTATGTLTDTDVDNPPNTFTAVTSPTPSNGGYGTFTMTAAGVWVYTPDNTNHAVQALNVGDKLTDTFTVTTVDGTRQLVTVTINGANDAAIISGDTAGSVIEDGGPKYGAPTATGTLTDTDVDNPSNSFTAVGSPTASTGGYGTFTMTADGAWTYTLNDKSHAVQALNVGDTLTDTFTVTTVDGTRQVVTITIEGSNDAAVISGTKCGSVTEAGGFANSKYGKPTATGTLTDTDIDNAPNTFTAVTTPKASTGGYGTFTMTAAGVWVYTLDNSNHAVQALNACDTLTDTFTVTTIDGTPQVVTITIDGTNDAAIISGTRTGSVTEAGGDDHGTPHATGTLTDTDVDNPDNSFIAVNYPKESDAGYGTFKMTADGVWTYTLDNKNCDVQALDDGDTLTDTFTVRTVDGTAMVVTITIHGSNDADPNDFDYLATGKKVISDGHFIYGTRGSDSIAGGGYHGQTIFAGAGSDTVNGTGKGDLIYAGSGNDTVKGNDGDDTIYGGSGSDTINGNNGCDTIIGGYGADKLTGGNGDDRFVFLSTADSNAARFDVVTDFRSGSDRIDLSALGALSFLALNSTSSFVPPHTVAWLHHGAANETIVYVNPTGHTLTIGDSGLMEIHLQGIASIEPSDIIPAPATVHMAAADEPANLDPATTADATLVSMTTDGTSFASTGGGPAQPVDGTHALLTSDSGSNSDEARAHVSEHTDDAAAATTAKGEPAATQHVEVTVPTESQLEFARTPVLHQGTGANAVNDDHAAPRQIEQVRVPASDVRIAPGHTTSESHSGTDSHSETESDVRPNRESHEIWHAGHDGPKIDSDRHDHGDGDRHSNPGESSSGHKHGGGGSDFEPSSIAHEVFGSGAAGKSGPGESFHFRNSGHEASDIIHLAYEDHITASMSHHGSDKGNSGHQSFFDDLSPSIHHSPDDHGGIPGHERHDVSHILHDLMV